MNISQHHDLKSIGPDVALNLDLNIRLRGLILYNIYMNFPVWETTSKTFFMIVRIILNFINALLNQMHGFDQPTISMSSLNINI